MIMMQCLLCWILNNVFFLHTSMSRLPGNGMQNMHSKCKMYLIVKMYICKISFPVFFAYKMYKYMQTMCSLCMYTFCFLTFIHFSRKFAVFFHPLSIQEFTFHWTSNNNMYEFKMSEFTIETLHFTFRCTRLPLHPNT